MWAAQVTHPERIDLIEVPEPAPPGPGSCRVRIDHLGVCGSDVRRGFRLQPDATYPLPAGFPGHELLGTVIKSRAEGIAENDQVLLHPPGLMGFQEQVVVSADRLAVVPYEEARADPNRWLMCEPASTVVHALHRLPPLLGQRVAVVGQGVMGLCWTTTVSRLGAAEVHVIDLEEARLARATALGADTTVRLTLDGITDPVRYGELGAFDVVIEAAGEVDSIHAALHLARREGLVVLFGTPAQPTVALDYRTLRDHELSTLCTAPGQGQRIGAVMAETVGLVERGWLDLGGLVTHEFPFEEATKGFTMADRREGDCVRVVLRASSPAA